MGMTAAELMRRMDATELDEHLALERLRESEHSREDMRHARLVLALHQTGSRSPGITYDEALPPVYPLATDDAPPAVAKPMTGRDRARHEQAALMGWVQASQRPRRTA